MRLWILVCCLLVPMAVWADTSSAERLDFEVRYRGLFSAGADVPIADVHLQTSRPGDAEYLETEMRVTSADYAAVEAFYPIRYLFRSWYPDDRSGSLVYEYQESNQQTPEEHKLTYFDQPGEPYVTHDLVALNSKMDLPTLRSGGYPVVEDLLRFDRLGLLQHVRAQTLTVGDRMQLSVSNGRQMLTYKIKVETEVQVQALGRQWDAVKVRFDGFELDERGREQAAHRPIYIWFSRDARHLPLVAVSRHTLGRFAVLLMGGDNLAVNPSQVAKDG